MTKTENGTATVLILAVLMVLGGCVAGPNTAAHVVGADGTIAGFWLGLWHGGISPFTFLVSLLTNDVSFYEVHNNGGWYNFGFVVGAGIFLGGGTLASKQP